MNRPHLVHIAPAGGCGGAESAKHKLAKELIAEHLNSDGGLAVTETCCRCYQQVTVQIKKSHKVVLEKQLPGGGGVADVALLGPDDSVNFVIEIYETHRTAFRGVEWVELKADDVLEAWDTTRLGGNMRVEGARQDYACGQQGCYDIQELAQKLGYLHVNPPDYNNEAEREVDAAMRGFYEQDGGRFWELGEASHDGSLWKDFLDRGVCMRCERGWDGSKYRPFCRTCYREVAFGETDEEPTRVSVSIEEKNRLRQKYKWLNQIPKAWSFGTPCHVCKKDWTGPNQAEDVKAYVWWFGKRCICSKCLEEFMTLSTLGVATK